MKAQKDNIEFLNISGKRAFMNNITKEMDIVNKINIFRRYSNITCTWFKANIFCT